MKSTKIIERTERLIGRKSLTDEDVCYLNDFFLTLSPRELEVFTIRFGMEGYKLPFSKNTLEVLTAYLEKTKASRNKREKRNPSALKDFIEPEEEEKMNESEKNIEIVRTFFYFAEKIRMEGVILIEEMLELEDESFFEEPENTIFVALAKKVLDGYASDEINKFYDELIEKKCVVSETGGAENACSKTIPLSFRLIKKGIQLISNGEAPENVPVILLKLIGEDSLKKYEPCIEQWKTDNKNRLKTLRENQAQKEAAQITAEVRERILQIDKILIKKEKEFAAALKSAQNDSNKKNAGGFINLNDEYGGIFLASAEFPANYVFLGKRNDKIRTPGEGMLSVCHSTMRLFDRAKFLSDKKDLNCLMSISENLTEFENRIIFEINTSDKKWWESFV